MKRVVIALLLGVSAVAVGYSPSSAAPVPGVWRILERPGHPFWAFMQEDATAGTTPGNYVLGKFEIEAHCRGDESVSFEITYDDARVPTRAYAHGTYGDVAAKVAIDGLPHWQPGTTSKALGDNVAIVTFGLCSLEGETCGGEVADLARAHEVWFMLPLDNGMTTTAWVHPQDRSFQAFEARCGISSG